MWTPTRKRQKKADDFINSADGEEHLHAWQKGLNKKYDKETGRIFNIRLPEHYAESLVELSESEDRSQHNLLLRMVCAAIDDAIKKA